MSIEFIPKSRASCGKKVLMQRKVNILAPNGENISEHQRYSSRFLRRVKTSLCLLKEIADVRRGFTTGANEFFYLTEDEIKERGIEKEFWMHKDEKGELGTKLYNQEFKGMQVNHC